MDVNELELPRRQLRTMHLFAGAGGGLLADILLGHVPVCAVEIDAYCRRVLLARQRDGYLPRFPIWDDVRTFNGKPWRGNVDCISGGFPCQDISVAGRRAGLSGERSGLWQEFARIIREIRPRNVFVENSTRLTCAGIGRILGDLAAMGFDARWGVFGACFAGLSHTRERMFIVANADGFDGEERMGHGEGSVWRRETAVCGPQHDQHAQGYFDVRMAAASRGDGVAHGVANRVDRVRSIGNGQVPEVAALAWRTLNR